jgi:PEP-CTERM motif
MFLLSLFLIRVLAAASCFAQGEVEFNTHISGLIVTRVYAPLSSDPTYHQSGNGSADTPVGTQDWSGYSLIGASGTGGQYGGGTTFAQLLGASGYNQTESSLLPAAPVTTFRTGSFAGFVTATTATFGNIPLGEAPATLEMVAWDNSSGLYPTWAQASVAWQSGLIAAGRSGLWSQDVITVPTLPDTAMINGQDPSQHVVSFNLYFIPEPSTFALAGLGVVMLLIYRGNRIIHGSTSKFRKRR